jgi:hypothetical protein
MSHLVVTWVPQHYVVYSSLAADSVELDDEAVAVVLLAKTVHLMAYYYLVPGHDLGFAGSLWSVF